MRIAFSAPSAAFILFATTAPAFAQDYERQAREMQIAQAIGAMIVHEERCELRIDDTAIVAFISSAFETIEAGMSQISMFQTGTEYEESDLDGLEKTVRCAGLNTFAEQNGLLREVEEAVVEDAIVVEPPISDKPTVRFVRPADNVPGEKFGSSAEDLTPTN